MTDNLLTLTRDGAVATLTLTRPEAVNALSTALLAALRQPSMTSKTTRRCASSSCAARGAVSVPAPI